MDHVAIMNKSWKLIPKIIDGRKKIESRWGINKCAPWGKVKVGDRIYFKNTGEPVIAVSDASKVLEFKDLTADLTEKIFKEYGKEIGISRENIIHNIKWAEKKRYCTLVYLKNSKIVKPFNINKKGFGSGCAWLTVRNIKDIKSINRS